MGYCSKDTCYLSFPHSHGTTAQDATLQRIQRALDVMQPWEPEYPDTPLARDWWRAVKILKGEE